MYRGAPPGTSARGCGPSPSEWLQWAQSRHFCDQAGWRSQWIQQGDHPAQLPQGGTGEGREDLRYPRRGDSADLPHASSRPQCRRGHASQTGTDVIFTLRKCNIAARRYRRGCGPCQTRAGNRNSGGDIPVTGRRCRCARHLAWRSRTSASPHRSGDARRGSAGAPRDTDSASSTVPPGDVTTAHLVAAAGCQRRGRRGQLGTGVKGIQN